MKCVVVGLCLLFALSATLAAPKAKRNVVCYFGSWSVYRHGAGNFDVEDIDPFVCTHLIFGFAKLDETTNTIASFDPYNDLYENWGKGAYERFTGLKKLNPELVTLLAIGGWNDGSTKYSNMALTAESRRTFVESVVPFVKQYGFDGLDVDWEYPTQRGGKAEDRDNFISLLEELRIEFDRESLLLTAAVSPGEQTMDEAFDIPAMARLLDMINIMSYDYHGGWEQVTGHNAPLYAHPLDDGNVTNFNVNFTVNYWIQNGAIPSKLNLGMPLYGRGWTLDDPTENGPYAPASYPIMAGPYTQQAGIWGYNELCEKFVAEGDKWTVARNEFFGAPYAYSGNRWIGFDDFESLAKKMELIDMYGLGGGMVWSIETDDFQQNCHSQPSPLITFIHEYLNGAIIRPTTTPCVGPSCVPPTTTQPPLTGDPSLHCPSEGYFGIDCDSYYYCQYNPNDETWNITYFTCAPGTAPNPAANSCDWAYNVPGCEEV